MNVRWRRPFLALALIAATSCGGSDGGGAPASSGGPTGSGGSAGSGGSGGSTGSPGAAGTGGNQAGGGGSAGRGGSGGSGTDAGACSVPPKGTKFTFHLHNPGTTTLTLFLGCSRSIPIVLDTPDGKLSVGPGSVDICEFTCEQVYARQVTPSGCSDCGPGYSKTIAAGATADIEWERLVYERHTVDIMCANGTGTCALGVPVAPSKMQTGVVTACAMPGPTAGCSQSKTVSFTVDTMESDATIELM